MCPTNSKWYWDKKRSDGKTNYEHYHWTAIQKKRRAARNNARAEAIRDWKVKKGDGKEVDHKNGNPTDNSKKNKRIISRKTNRVLWAAKANKKKPKTNLHYV